MGSEKCPCIGSNPTTYHFKAMPFAEWFKVTYMSPMTHRFYVVAPKTHLGSDMDPNMGTTRKLNCLRQ
ncbi:hypothetical protein E2C01_052460 [Portunus trituberculatus]|uniref:Uncharacterized protein n=1 Tax=Portunus trituberculatus TaxID=210409 RepID=A0A5B7GLX9_PORTR|nr:hypothetical protein [Portunus trituberculatus]